MADYINLEESEINTVLETLIATHQLEVEAIDSLDSQLRELMMFTAGGFYADKVCGYLFEVLDLLEGNVMPYVEEQFALTEQGIQAFVATVNNLDTI